MDRTGFPRRRSLEPKNPGGLARLDRAAFADDSAPVCRGLKNLSGQNRDYL
jgi:hypothetical protein